MVLKLVENKKGNLCKNALASIFQREKQMLQQIFKCFHLLRNDDLKKIFFKSILLYFSKDHYLKFYSGGSDGKVSACNVGDLGSIPGLGRSPGEGNGNPLQHSCPENPIDGEA